MTEHEENTVADAERVDAPRQTDEAAPLVPKLTEELLHTLPVPIAAAIHQLKISRDGERRRADAAERRHSELRAEIEQLRAQQQPLSDEYGLRITYVSTLIEERAIADTLAGALEVLAAFDARDRRDVVSRELMQRPVGKWRKVEEDGRG